MNTMIQKLQAEIADLLSLNEEWDQGYAQVGSGPRSGFGLQVHEGFWSACAFDEKRAIYTLEYPTADEALEALENVNSAVSRLAAFVEKLKAWDFGDGNADEIVFAEWRDHLVTLEKDGEKWLVIHGGWENDYYSYVEAVGVFIGRVEKIVQSEVDGLPETIRSDGRIKHAVTRTVPHFTNELDKRIAIKKSLVSAICRYKPRYTYDFAEYLVAQNPRLVMSWSTSGLLRREKDIRKDTIMNLKAQLKEMRGVKYARRELTMREGHSLALVYNNGKWHGVEASDKNSRYTGEYGTGVEAIHALLRGDVPHKTPGGKKYITPNFTE